MDRFFNYLFNITVKQENIREPKTRTKIASLQGFSSIILNLFIFTAKITAGLLIKSVSLIADAFHTLSDILSSVIIMIGFKFAQKPADKEHPFGHQRIESITGIIISILLIFTGIEFIKTSFKRIFEPSIHSPNLIIIALIILTIFLKEFMARFALFLGDKINSSALKADFLHHRIDALSSIFVLIALISSIFNFPSIDGYMGLIVSAMIILSGIEILKESSFDLIGKAPDEKILQQLHDIVSNYRDKGVFGVHDIIINTYGQKIIGTIHVEIDENMNLLKAHTVSEMIEQEINEKTGMFITVHIDPINMHNPIVLKIREKINDYIKSYSYIDSAHDVRIIGEDNWYNVAFDLIFNENVSKYNKETIYNDLKTKLKNDFPEINEIVIKYEPLFSY